MGEGSLRSERKRMDFKSYILITLKKRGRKYTVLGDREKAVELYQGEIDPKKVLVSNEVFLDIQKGEKPSTDALKELVVDNRLKEANLQPSPEHRRKIHQKIEKLDLNSIKSEAATYVAAHGRIRLPKEVRDSLIKKREEKLLNYLQKYAVNPATGHPYPPKKVEEVFNSSVKGRVEIDPLVKAEKQVLRVVDAVKERLPLKLEVLTVKITMPPQYSGKGYSEIKQLGEVKHREWKEDGSLEAKIKIPGGSYLRLKQRLGDLSRGRAQTEIIERAKIS